MSEIVKKCTIIVKSHPQRKLYILIANDTPFLLLVIYKSLEKLKFIDKIDQANNGQEALDLVLENSADPNSRKYDLIFLDLGMPIKDGYEACILIL